MLQQYLNIQKIFMITKCLINQINNLQVGSLNMNMGDNSLYPKDFHEFSLTIEIYNCPKKLIEFGLYRTN